MRLSLPKGISRGLLALGVVLATGVFAPDFVAAESQSQTEAQLVSRVQDLEASVRDLTGQVQGLEFDLKNLQEKFDKMQQDDEFRFQQLEGGAPKKSDAATHSGGAMPSGALPQAPSGEPVTDNNAASASAPADTAGADRGIDPAASSASATPDDGLGQSADPLVGKGGDASSAVLGTLPADSNGQPLNLSLDTSSKPPSSGDADAQYKAGYDAIMRGDYSFAEDQFRQFIALYPDNPQAADATNWLGEALLQRKAYDEAADALLTGFKNYPNSPRAPDLLLKLGIAMVGAGQQPAGCEVFADVAKRFPKQPAAFTQRLAAEKSKAQCPA